MAPASLFRVLGLSVPLCLAVGACGGSSSSGGGTSGGPMTLDQLVPKLVETICSTAETCLGPLFGALVNATDCETLYGTSINEGSFSLVEGGIADGTIVYDGTKAQACLDAIEQAGCGFLGQRLSLLCSSALAGTKGGGTTCTYNEECAPGLFCKMDQCPGACTSLLTAGSACTDSDECASGLTCDDDTKLCRTATSIQVSGADGAACDPAAAELCQTGLVCALVGAPTTAGGPAAWRCEGPATGTTCHFAIPEGCPSGQYCELPVGSVSGTCTDMPAIGSACGTRLPSDPPSACPKDSVCSLGTCKAFVALGSPCADDVECYSEVCVAGTCEATRCSN